MQLVRDVHDLAPLRLRGAGPRAGCDGSCVGCTEEGACSFGDAVPATQPPTPPTQHCDSDEDAAVRDGLWVRPSPKQHAYLLFGFCLARANARMLINAASKRSSAKNAVRASRPRSTSPVAVNG